MLAKAKEQNTTAVATLKYPITHENFFVYHVFLKKLHRNVLDIFLTPIPPNKNVSALKEVTFITSDLLNTKFFVIHRRI